MIIILFSEHEEYYRDLGLIDVNDMSYVFGGCQLYKKNLTYLATFDAFVCSFYTMPHNIILTNKFKSLNIKTVLCSDGIFDFSNSFNNPMVKKYEVALFHPVIQDYFLCVGQNEKEYFSDSVTTLRFVPERMLSTTDVIQEPKLKRTLITTANTAYFSEEEFERLFSLLLDITLLLNNNEIVFSFRIFDERLLTALYERLDFKIANDIDNDFETTLALYSSVITTPSSIAITAMYHQRSVSLLIYRDCPMLMQAGWLTPSADVLESSLDSFVNAEASRITIQNRLLKAYLTKNGLNEHLQTILNYEINSTAKDLEIYINKSLLNMLESKFNFNFEWFVRRIYLSFKKTKLMKNVRNWIQ